jgi:hypothetical protein
MNSCDTNGSSPDELDWASDTLFYGTIETLERLEQIAQLAIDKIHKSDSARLVLIEAWILLDFAVREFLLSGLDVKKLSADKFDLGYELLPRSFLGCLNILERLTKVQSDLLPRPEVIDHRVGISMSFLSFLKNEQPEDFERFSVLKQEYYKKHHPELAGPNIVVLNPETKHALLGEPPPKFRQINCEWLKIAERLDDNWYKNAKRLNEARNKAAHSYDETRVLGSMGCRGPDALKHLKEKCADLIQMLVGVKKIKHSEP